MDGQKYGWTGDGRGKKRRSKKKKKKKNVFQNHRYLDIVSYVLKVSVNGVICVFGTHFRSSGTLESS